MACKDSEPAACSSLIVEARSAALARALAVGRPCRPLEPLCSSGHLDRRSRVPRRHSARVLRVMNHRHHRLKNPALPKLDGTRGAAPARALRRDSTSPESAPARLFGFRSFSSNAVTAVTGTVGSYRIISLTVGMEIERNQSNGGGRYAQDHHRRSDRSHRDAHYGMGGIKSSSHDQRARRRQRAHARVSPVVKSGIEHTHKNELWPERDQPAGIQNVDSRPCQARGEGARHLGRDEPGRAQLHSLRHFST
jgi:hypothetical protein